MLKVFEKVVESVDYKPKKVTIDNFLAKLHYRATFAILLIASTLVCSRQYFGEHIKCVADTAIPGHVLETYCFFMATYTVVKHLDPQAVSKGSIPYSGIGPYVKNEDKVLNHNYYQWVPIVLFVQAMFFYVPHYIWKDVEGGRMSKMVSGLDNAYLWHLKKNIKVKPKVTIPGKQERKKKIRLLRDVFIDRLHLNKWWAAQLLFFENLNAVVLALNIYVTDKFLGGTFLDLGIRLAADMIAEKEIELLDVVFPKLTKCDFQKYGPSGSLQRHDALCVMALNIVNEKIYIFLWFWMAFLCVATVLTLLWRILSAFLHSRSGRFNRYIFELGIPKKHSVWAVVKVTKECYYSDWLFLYYLSKNLDGFVFRKLFLATAVKMNDGEVPKDLDYSEDDDDDEETAKGPSGTSADAKASTSANADDDDSEEEAEDDKKGKKK